MDWLFSPVGVRFQKILAIVLGLTFITLGVMSVVGGLTWANLAQGVILAIFGLIGIGYGLVLIGLR